jgi:cell division septum initiation protein DivIVA
MAYTSSASDLPPALASLLNVGSSATTMPMNGGISTAGMAPAMAPMVPAFQMGGMVGPGGMPMMGGAPMGGAPGLAPPGAISQSLSPEQIPMEVQRFVQQNPQQVQQMVAALQQLIQSGGVTVEELNMMIQMAQAAAQNPALYPQLRQIAIQRGLAGPEEISEQFDSGLIFTLLLMGAALQSGGMMPGQMPSLKKGGMLSKKESDDEAVIAQLHEGEYVIPAHIVRAKGTEFFDKMLSSYKQESDESDD